MAIGTEYIGTTVVDVTHLTQTKKATFYVTNLNNDKVILGLHLCIDLQLLSYYYYNYLIPHGADFVFMKLPFRLCESQYFFQYYMDLNFESLTNAHIIADDVLIAGSDQGPSDDWDHDRCLLQVLNRC